MSGSRKALIVANDTYDHDGLNHLLAPQADAEALAGVLGNAAIGDFDVRVVRNEPAHVIREEIEDLFSDSRPDDVLLLHFSCHGLKGDSGELFFATRNTRPNRLGSTAISADFVQRCMRASRSRSIVLLLDCCYGGAFSTGVKVRAAGDVNVFDSFPGGESGGGRGGGRGRAVITASSAMEYAFEGDQLADDQSRQPSVFTSALVEGLATGDADRDQDGWVSLNELYDYVFDRVRERNPHQTPSRDVEMQGELYVARRSRPVTSAAPLPPELQSVIDHPIGSIRAGAVQELARLAHGKHAGMALAAREALEHLATDDSRTVASAAAAALAGDAPIPALSVDTPVAAPAPAPAPPPRSRRWVYAAAAALVVTAGAVFALTQLGDDDGDSTPSVTTSAQSFTARSPWRLTIKDNAQGNDPGCDVTVQRVGGDQPLPVPTDVYLPVTLQVRESGEFRWSANSPVCLTQPRPGAGTATLPFVPEILGDTDAFKPSGPVPVAIVDSQGNSSCKVELHNAADGRVIDVREVPKDGSTTIDPLGASSVYLNVRYCTVRVG